jgi:uncharacterized protein YjiS (DUF1127 family)
MAANGEIRFRSENIFAGNTGIIDGTVIRGVSVITGDQVAEGHGLTIDDTTLSQLQACAKERGKVPVCLDHGSGVKDLNGFLTGFRIDGSGDKPKIRTDWHLLETHPETATMLEKAEKIPDCFGLSVAFKGPPKGVAIGGGKMAARCEKLLSVDCVTRPAANTGLFSVPEVDKSVKNMAKEKTEQNPPAGDPPPAEPTMADIMEALNQLNGRLDQHEQFLGQLQGPQEDQGPTLEQLTQASDEELAQLGLTRAEVNAAVQEVLAGMEAEGRQPGAEGEQVPGAISEGELAGASAAAGAPAGFGGGETPATFSAAMKRIVQLENNQRLIELRKKQDAEEVELKSIEDKVLVLAKQRDEAIQLAETQASEIEALRLAVKTGTRPVVAGGGDDGVRMFGANDNGQLHEFQVRVKQLVESGKSEGQAVQLAVKENPARHADYVMTLGKKNAA